MASPEVQAKIKDYKMFIETAQEKEKEKNYAEAKKFYFKAAVTCSELRKIDPNKYNCEQYVLKGLEAGNKAKEMEAKDKENKKIKVDDDKDDPDAKLKESLSGCLVTELPNVRWDDVAGLEKAKEALKEAVVLPIKFPQLFEGKRRPWKGILLYGPPGTGKSYLAKAAATETGGKFFSVSAANIVSKWMGESERLVKGLFDLARKSKPAVIFMDEIDSVMSARGEGDNDATRRLKTEFLIQMQGVGNDDDGILVLGATNIPWGLDPAVRRRFQKKIYISLPDKPARKNMFRLNIGDTDNDITDAEYDVLADLTDGYSGSDIATLTQDAIYEPLRKCQQAKFFRKEGDGLVPCPPSAPGAQKQTMNELENPSLLRPPKVCFEDYIKAIQKIKPTVNKADLKKQEEFTQEFGQEG